jgi:hypothetical protein
MGLFSIISFSNASADNGARAPPAAVILINSRLDFMIRFFINKLSFTKATSNFLRKRIEKILRVLCVGQVKIKNEIAN